MYPWLCFDFVIRAVDRMAFQLAMISEFISRPFPTVILPHPSYLPLSYHTTTSLSITIRGEFFWQVLHVFVLYCTVQCRTQYPVPSTNLPSKHSNTMRIEFRYKNLPTYLPHYRQDKNSIPEFTTVSTFSVIQPYTRNTVGKSSLDKATSILYNIFCVAS